MSALSDALAARECERVHLIEAVKRYMKAYGPGYSTTDTLPYDALVGVLSAVATEPAPDMAAWIEKALPWIGVAREQVQEFIDMIQDVEEMQGSEELEHSKQKLVELDALLAEAKGDNHAEN